MPVTESTSSNTDYHLTGYELSVHTVNLLNMSTEITLASVINSQKTYLIHLNIKSFLNMHSQKHNIPHFYPLHSTSYIINITIIPFLCYL